MTQAAAPTKLWNRNFMLWWLGAAQSAFGSAVAGIALSFLVLHQTGSVSAMGVNLALGMIPALASPFFGTLVDRLPLKLPLVAGNVLRGVLQLAVGFVALSGHVPLWFIYTVSFLTGLMGAFYGPASMGVTPSLVHKDHWQQASGLMQGTNQSMQMIGLIGGGFLVGFLGKAQSLMLDGVTFLVFGALLLLIHFPPRAGAAAGEGFTESFRAGLRYVRGSLLLTCFPFVALILNAAFAPQEMLLPKRMLQLGAGAAGFGLFEGMMLAGIAGGNFLLAALGKRVQGSFVSTLGLIGMGVLTLGLAASQTAPQMYVLAVAMGLLNACANMGISLIFMGRVQPEFYGRVGSLLSAVGMVGQPLTLLALAPIADRVPIQGMFGVAGLLTMLGGLVWLWILRREPAVSPPPVPLPASGP